MRDNPLIEVSRYMGFTCNYLNNSITVGFKKKQLENFESLTDKEKNIFINGALTHEYLHWLLKEMFDSVVASLFDSIGDGLKNKTIGRKVYKKSGFVLWSDAVKRQGFEKAILEYYGISQRMLHSAKNVCNVRGCSHE